MSGRRKKPSADDATKAEKRRESNHVDEEVGAATEQDDQAEETFWWDFFERKDALENGLEELQRVDANTFDQFATKKQEIAELQRLLNGMAKLARQGSVNPVPNELAHLRRWYSRLTPEQRNPWARGLGPNVPFASYGLKRETLDTIQSAYDECTLRYGKAPQETVASVAGRARSTVQRYWKHLKK
jgi:hypothetical protein